MLHMLLDIIYLHVNACYPFCCCIVSSAPEMPFWISQSEVLLNAEYFPRRITFEQLRCLLCSHALRNVRDHVHVLRKHIQCKNLYPIPVCSLSDASCNEISVLELSHHLVAVLRAPFEHP